MDVQLHFPMSTHSMHTFQVLLQVLDAARSTDSQGRTVSFKNTIILMTSNVGQKEVLKSLRSNTSKGRLMMSEVLKSQ